MSDQRCGRTDKDSDMSTGAWTGKIRLRRFRHGERPPPARPGCKANYIHASPIVRFSLEDNDMLGGVVVVVVLWVYEEREAAGRDDERTHPG
ncbi:unnamed protein product [Heligmosomoides polygyrus]|uniref:Uncharacterized protein n=1 Tax=Heligmosomoides polygyrus TaxID=6339 RepID=A0A183FMZ4_HELPZ|nr:unnamed protein product [Heligmosomoides polygyrus]